VSAATGCLSLSPIHPQHNWNVKGIGFVLIFVLRFGSDHNGKNIPNDNEIYQTLFNIPNDLELYPSIYIYIYIYVIYTYNIYIQFPSFY
jgi:hypothetical protein